MQQCCLKETVRSIWPISRASPLMQHYLAHFHTISLSFVASPMGKVVPTHVCCGLSDKTVMYSWMVIPICLHVCHNDIITKQHAIRGCIYDLRWHAFQILMSWVGGSLCGIVRNMQSLHSTPIYNPTPLNQVIPKRTERHFTQKKTQRSMNSMSWEALWSI